MKPLMCGQLFSMICPGSPRIEMTEVAGAVRTQFQSQILVDETQSIKSVSHSIALTTEDCMPVAKKETKPRAGVGSNLNKLLKFTSKRILTGAHL